MQESFTSRFVTFIRKAGLLSFDLDVSMNQHQHLFRDTVETLDFTCDLNIFRTGINETLMSFWPTGE
jgi:hypothetical protein